jgi:hypothetical protein
VVFAPEQSPNRRKRLTGLLKRKIPAQHNVKPSQKKVPGAPAGPLRPDIAGSTVTKEIFYRSAAPPFSFFANRYIFCINKHLIFIKKSDTY